MDLLLLRARTAIRSGPGELLRRCSAARRWSAIDIDMAHGAKRFQATWALAKVDRLAHDVWHSIRVGHLDGPSAPWPEVVDGFFQGL